PTRRCSLPACETRRSSSRPTECSSSPFRRREISGPPSRRCRGERTPDLPAPELHKHCEFRLLLDFKGFRAYHEGLHKRETPRRKRRIVELSAWMYWRWKRDS